MLGRLDVAWPVDDRHEAGRSERGRRRGEVVATQNRTDISQTGRLVSVTIGEPGSAVAPWRRHVYDLPANAAQRRHAHAPVVEDEDIDAGEPDEQSCVGAVGAGERELVEEPRGAAVDRPVTPTQGVLGAGDEGLAHAGGPGDAGRPTGKSPADG